jgi:hypothetical protein
MSKFWQGDVVDGDDFELHVNYGFVDIRVEVV